MELISLMFILLQRFFFFCIQMFWILEFVGFLILLIPLQADALSRYKPVINSTSLIHDLQETENSAAKALEYFNTTRHIVVFYEDLITNQTVSFRNNQSYAIVFCLTRLLIPMEFDADIETSSRVFEHSSEGFVKQTGENT